MTMDELRSELHWTLAKHGDKRDWQAVAPLPQELVEVFKSATGLTDADLEALMAKRSPTKPDADFGQAIARQPATLESSRDPANPNARSFFVVKP